MSIEEEAQRLIASYRPTRTCKVESSGNVALVDALAKNNATGFLIQRILNDRGVRIAGDTIRAHIRKECQCQKS